MKVLLSSLAVAAALLLLATSNASAAPMIGFALGMDKFGTFALRNTSDAASIESITIALPSSTFFDTSPGGLGGGIPWSAGINSGVQSVTFPANNSDDGLSLTTIYFTGFDPSDALYFATDLDRFDDIDGPSQGEPLGTQISVLFSTDDTLYATVVAIPVGFVINGTPTSFDHSTSASQALATEVPEPTSLIVWSLIGLSGVIAWGRRR